MELHEPPFCKKPRGLNAVDMPLAIGMDELVLSMVHTIVFFIAQVNQATVIAPVIRMDHAIRIYLAANDSL